MFNFCEPRGRFLCTVPEDGMSSVKHASARSYILNPELLALAETEPALAVEAPRRDKFRGAQIVRRASEAEQAASIRKTVRGPNVHLKLRASEPIALAEALAQKCSAMDSRMALTCRILTAITATEFEAIVLPVRFVGPQRPSHYLKS